MTINVFYKVIAGSLYDLIDLFCGRKKQKFRQIIDTQ